MASSAFTLSEESVSYFRKKQQYINNVLQLKVGHFFAFFGHISDFLENVHPPFKIWFLNSSFVIRVKFQTKIRFVFRRILNNKTQFQSFISGCKLSKKRDQV